MKQEEHIFLSVFSLYTYAMCLAEEGDTTEELDNSPLEMLMVSYATTSAMGRVLIKTGHPPPSQWVSGRIKGFLN